MKLYFNSHKVLYDHVQILYDGYMYGLNHTYITYDELCLYLKETLGVSVLGKNFNSFFFSLNCFCEFFLTF